VSYTLHPLLNLVSPDSISFASNRFTKHNRFAVGFPAGNAGARGGPRVRHKAPLAVLELVEEVQRHTRELVMGRTQSRLDRMAWPTGIHRGKLLFI